MSVNNLKYQRLAHKLHIPTCNSQLRFIKYQSTTRNTQLVTLKLSLHIAKNSLERDSEVIALNILKLFENIKLEHFCFCFNNKSCQFSYNSQKTVFEFFNKTDLINF